MQGFKRCFAALLCLLLLANLCPSASAQNQGVAGSGLSITPTLAEFTLQPGKTTNLVITIKDSTVGSIQAQAVVNDFTSDGNSGNPKLIVAPNETSPNSIKNFVFQLDSVPLDPGQQKDVSVGIHIPDGTPPGAYYGVIRYKAVPLGAVSSGKGKVALTASVGTIVLITVPGKVRELVKIGDLHIYHGTNEGRIFLNKPDHIGVEVQNLGNGFERPFGTVEVQNMFHKEVASYQFNNPHQLGAVLPGSTRIFTNSVKGINQFGRYTTTVNIAYGNGTNPKIVTINKIFWYVPAWMAITVVVVLVVLSLLTIRLYIRYRRDAKRSYRNR